MAKDPAFLFYPGDWQGGTSTFSRFLKGCYMDVLIAQFNNGHLSLDEIKTVLGSDFGTAWPTLQKKFVADVKGLMFNEKLDNEITKRRLYSESRRENRKKKTHDSTYDKDMKGRMEIGDGIEDEVRVVLKKENGKIVPREVFDETLQDVEVWTKQVVDGDDALFLSMVRGANLILNGQLASLASDHLGKCARYNWHERMTTQQAFRHSLLNYITENLKSQKVDKNGKPALTLDQIRAGKNNV